MKIPPIPARIIILLAAICITEMAPGQIRGVISDQSTGEKLPGATVIISHPLQSVISNAAGQFTINAKPGDTLQISYVGYKTKNMTVISGTSYLEITLEVYANQLNDLIVTGVFDPRKRIESSIAITTIATAQLEHIVPNSSSELLRLVPGVFVQSARGELRNQIFTRGMVFDGSVYFISMQEDGLPLLPGQGGNPSAYLRADVNLSKIEAVRGGSASILGVNAPGGIFNYISKTGGKQFEGVVSTRLGLEGNGKNPYYRIEGNFGGPLNKDKSWTYNIGGHYRYANGAKYPGYPLSHGGQIKGNIVKTFATGSLKLTVKWLNDRTKDFEFTPTVDFYKPRPAGHFTNSSSVLIDPVQLTIPSTGDGVRSIDYDSKDLNHLKDNSISLHWEQRLNDNWKMTQAFKLSQKSSVDVGTFIVYPNDVTSFFFNLIFDMLGKEGKYKFYNATTKQVYGILTQDFAQPDPFKFEGNLPGSDIISNGVFYTPLTIVDDKRKDFFYQGTISKAWKNMKFTAGVYSNKSTYKYYSSAADLGAGFSTIEDRPQLIAIEYAPAGGGPVQQYTDAKGVSGYQRGPEYASYNIVKTWDNAIYFGHQWDITPRLNLDWGGRYEWLDLINTYRVQNANTNSATGGIDKNPLTLYDNYEGSLAPPVTYIKHASTYSYSAGLNYKQNDHLAYYVRFSSGNKVPDISTYIGSQRGGEAANVLPQKTVQLEGGIKYLSAKTNITVTPFLSILSSLPTSTFDVDTTGNLYNLPILYNKVHATGIELETTIQLHPRWNVRANAVFQQFFTDKYQQWDTGMPGALDDKIIDQSGKKISFFAAPYIFNITPSYNYKKIYAALNWYSISKRAANANEAFYFPAYSQFDLNIGYALTKKVNLKFSINNLTNHFGIVDWTAPIQDGIFFSTFNSPAFSMDDRYRNPNAIYYTMGIQPRSFWLDLSIKL
jgi:iron complex outermembrane recepter protein